jgi:hypothetical protein
MSGEEGMGRESVESKDGRLAKGSRPDLIDEVMQDVKRGGGSQEGSRPIAGRREEQFAADSGRKDEVKEEDKEREQSEQLGWRER